MFIIFSKPASMKLNRIISNIISNTLRYSAAADATTNAAADATRVHNAILTNYDESNTSVSYNTTIRYFSNI